MTKATFIRTLDPTEVVGKPDTLTVLWPFDMKPVIICANQCIRDKDHACLTPVSVKQLFGNAWVEAVTENPAWLILTWGPHRHTLPFCCVRCMFEFVNDRLEGQGDGAISVKDKSDKLNLVQAAGKLWMAEHGECPTHGVVSCAHRCSNYDGEVFENGYAPQGIERARAYLMDNPRG